MHREFIFGNKHRTREHSTRGSNSGKEQQRRPPSTRESKGEPCGPPVEGVLGLPVAFKSIYHTRHHQILSPFMHAQYVLKIVERCCLRFFDVLILSLLLFLFFPAKVLVLWVCCIDLYSIPIKKNITKLHFPIPR